MTGQIREFRFCRIKLDSLCRTPAHRALRASEGLDVHPKIELACDQLYRDGHYSNAVEDAVKAPHALVRLNGGVDDKDGTTLMETVFSPKSPILKLIRDVPLRWNSSHS
jgi:hypothetical protein